MHIQPTVQHLEQLRAALLDAFDHASLTRLVHDTLKLNLEWNTPNYYQREPDILFVNLVTYYASQKDGLKYLLDIAYEQHPNNQLLATLRSKWAGLDFETIPQSEQHTIVNHPITIPMSDEFHSDRPVGNIIIKGSVSGSVIITGNDNLVVFNDNTPGHPERGIDILVKYGHLRSNEIDYAKRQISKYENWSEMYISLSGIVIKDDPLTNMHYKSRPFEVREYFQQYWDANQQPERRLVNDLCKVTSEYRRVILLGDGGEGKSTTLKRLAYDYSQKALNDVNAPLPLFVPLNTYHSDSSLLNFIGSYFDELSPFLLGYLRYNRVILLLDGLNEIGEQFYNEAIRSIGELLEEYENLSIVITSRKQEYKGTLNLKRIEIKPLNSEQMRKYLQCYMNNRKQCDEFLDQLVNEPGFLEFSNNPYFLMILSSLYPKYQNDLPKNRGHLLADYINFTLCREVNRSSLEFESTSFSHGTKYLLDLRTTLSQLYPDINSIRRIVDDSGIDQSHVNFDDKAINSWHSVLIEANKTGRIYTLLQVVKTEYGTNEDLQKAFTTFERSIINSDHAHVREPSPSERLPKTVIVLRESLAKLAFKVQKEKGYGATIDYQELIGYINDYNLSPETAFELMNNAGILVVNNEQVKFSHQSLQAYFVAIHISNNLDNAEVNELISKYITDERWRETFSFVASTINGSNTFIQQLRQSIDDVFRENFTIVNILTTVNEEIEVDSPFPKPEIDRAYRLFLYLAQRVAQELEGFGKQLDVHYSNVQAALEFNKSEYDALREGLHTLFTDPTKLEIEDAYLGAIGYARFCGKLLDSINFDNSSDNSEKYEFVSKLSHVGHLANSLVLALGRSSDIKAANDLDLLSNLHMTLNAASYLANCLANYWERGQISHSENNLFAEGIIRLSNYITLNEFLVQCMKIAHVSSVHGMENRILIPPIPGLQST